MRNWLPRIGWETLDPHEALELGFEQASRVTWQIWRVEWFGVGFSVFRRRI